MEVKNSKLKKLVEAVKDVLPDMVKNGCGNDAVAFLYSVTKNVYGEQQAVAAELGEFNNQTAKAQARPSVVIASNELSKVGSTGSQGCGGCGDEQDVLVAAIGDNMALAVGGEDEDSPEDGQGFQEAADQIGAQEAPEAKKAPELPSVFGKGEKSLPDTPEQCESLEQLRQLYGFDRGRNKTDIIQALKADFDRLQIDTNGKRSADDLAEELYNQLNPGQ
jgi:hypothetical protein